MHRCLTAALQAGQITTDYPDVKRGLHRGFRISCAILRPCAESPMRVASRRACVSAFFALMTHQMAARWYEGACAWKNSHAAWSARNSCSCSELNAGVCPCSNE
jgi:hypothetical protein